MQSTPTQTISADCLASLSSHLRTKLANPEDAEDIAQEACFKLLQAQHRNLEIRNPRAYLRQIAHNLLYFHYMNCGQLTIDTDVEVETLTTNDPCTETRVDDALRVEGINSAWRELSPKCRQALLLRWREGLRIAEIAEQMTLSRAMVKKYLAKGLKHFRQRLNPHNCSDRADWHQPTCCGPTTEGHL